MLIKQRHQNTLALSAALASTLITCGCTSLGDALSGDKVDYRASGSQSVKLEVPPDLSQLPGQSRYGQITASSVSANSLGREKAQATEVQAVEPNNTIAPLSSGTVKLERQGQMRWLVVGIPP